MTVDAFKGVHDPQLIKNIKAISERSAKSFFLFMALNKLTAKDLQNLFECVCMDVIRHYNATREKRRGKEVLN